MELDIKTEKLDLDTKGSFYQAFVKLKNSLFCSWHINERKAEESLKERVNGQQEK